MENPIASTTSKISAKNTHHKNENTLRKKGFRAMTRNSKPLLLDIHSARCHGEIQQHNGFRIIFDFGPSADSRDTMVTGWLPTITILSLEFADGPKSTIILRVWSPSMFKGSIQWKTPLNPAICIAIFNAINAAGRPRPAIDF